MRERRYMGYLRNHVIIVNSFSKEDIEKVHNKAMELFPELTTELKETPVNSDYSFAILPDGSKEGWSESDDYDSKRNIFKKFIKTFDYEDGSNPLKVVQVWFDEEGKSNIDWVV